MKSNVQFAEKKLKPITMVLSIALNVGFGSVMIMQDQAEHNAQSANLTH